MKYLDPERDELETPQVGRNKVVTSSQSSQEKSQHKESLMKEKDNINIIIDQQGSACAKNEKCAAYFAEMVKSGSGQKQKETPIESKSKKSQSAEREKTLNR